MNDDHGTRVKKRGRRTLCTPQKIRALCKFLSGACTIRTACEATGISEASFHDWVARGERGEKPFSEFLQAVTRARGEGKAKLVKSIIGSRDWRARLEILARVYPSEYARTEPRIIIVQQPPAPPMPPPTTSVTREWTKDVNIPPQLTKYLDLLKRAESISVRAKVSAANKNGEKTGG
jgi:hypothetical protein